MTEMGRLVLSAVLLAATSGLLGLAVTPVRACTCGAFSAEQSALHADVVVVGTITIAGIETGNPSAGLDCAKAGGQSGVISVERYMKGSGSKQLFFANSAPSPCRTIVTIGQRYAVFLYGQPGSYAADAVDLCSGCDDDPKLTAIERALAGESVSTPTGAGLPKAAEPLPGEDGGSWAAVVAAGVPLVSVLAGAAVLLLLRRGTR